MAIDIQVGQFPIPGTNEITVGLVNVEKDNEKINYASVYVSKKAISEFGKSKKIVVRPLYITNQNSWRHNRAVRERLASIEIHSDGKMQLSMSETIMDQFTQQVKGGKMQVRSIVLKNGKGEEKTLDLKKALGVISDDHEKLLDQVYNIYLQNTREALQKIMQAQAKS